MHLTLDPTRPGPAGTVESDSTVHVNSGVTLHSTGRRAMLLLTTLRFKRNKWSGSCTVIYVSSFRSLLQQKTQSRKQTDNKHNNGNKRTKPWVALGSSMLLNLIF